MGLGRDRRRGARGAGRAARAQVDDSGDLLDRRTHSAARRRPRPFHPIGRQRHDRRDRGGGGPRRSQLRRRHRSRRRHPAGPGARLSLRGARHRRCRDQHHARPLRGARPGPGPVSPGRRRRRRRRRRPPARRVRHRRAPRLTEAGALVARLAGADRRLRVVQSGFRVARRRDAAAGARADLLPAAAGAVAGPARRRRRRHAAALGIAGGAAPDDRPGRGRRPCPPRQRGRLRSRLVQPARPGLPGNLRDGAGERRIGRHADRGRGARRRSGARRAARRPQLHVPSPPGPRPGGWRSPPIAATAARGWGSSSPAPAA